MRRRNFLKGLAALAGGAGVATGVKAIEPVAVPAQNTYGRGAGEDAIDDAKRLAELELAQKIANPPLSVAPDGTVVRVGIPDGTWRAVGIRWEED